MDEFDTPDVDGKETGFRDHLLPPTQYSYMRDIRVMQKTSTWICYIQTGLLIPVIIVLFQNVVKSLILCLSYEKQRAYSGCCHLVVASPSRALVCVAELRFAWSMRGFACVI